MSDDDISKLLREVVEESETSMDKLITELISIATSHRYKIDGSDLNRRDAMEKLMKQYCSDNMKEVDDE